MTLDALGYESQFIDHLAPVWSLLPDRGTFYVEPSLIGHAAKRGIEAVPAPRLMINRGGMIRQNLDADRPCLVASYGDMKEGRRLGYGPFVFLEHGAAQSYAGDPRSAQARNPSYTGGADREDVALFLTPSAGAAQRWMDAYPAARAVAVGTPRLDSLPRRIPDGQVTVAVSFHFDASRVAPEAGSAIGDFGPVIEELAKRFHVIGHEHPRWAAEHRSLERQYRRWGIEYVGDFEDVCRRADVYVCDNSSTIPEFASTGRPVVLMNARQYRRPPFSHGGRFWDWATIGIQVDDPALLGDAVADALTDPPEVAEARRYALFRVYAYLSGGAARAVEAIAQWQAGETPTEVRAE